MAIERPRQAGRPQDDQLTRRILRETISSLRAGGYGGLRIERVADAVGCGKTAIYRRWPTKAALVAEAIKHNTRIGTMPDTGDVVEDLAVHATQNPMNYAKESKSDRPIWSALVEPEVRELFWEGFLAQRRQNGRQILDRAVSRGQLPPDTDKDMLLDLLAGFTMYRTTVRLAPVSADEYRAVITALTVSPPLGRSDPTSVRLSPMS